MSTDSLRLISFSDASQAIKGGDLLLYRAPRGFWGLVSIVGRGRHSHAALAAWWGSTLMAVESTSGGGCHAVSLANQVADQPGRIDVFAANPGKGFCWSDASTVRAARESTGRRYGWLALLRVACFHIPGLRLFVRPIHDDKGRSLGRQFCSAAVSRWYRAGGVDPVSLLADSCTEPADLARSPFFEYLCTLVPDTKRNGGWKP